MTALIVTEGPAAWDIDVWWGEDWYDPLPQFVDPVTGDPVDLTDIELELYARPSFDHAVRFLLMTSASSITAGSSIIKDDAVNGLVSFYSQQSSVELTLPVNFAQPWRQFLRVAFVDPDLGIMHKIIWTGALVVHPARTAATV